MNYLNLPGLDSPVSIFDICQAHAQLEADYNVGGWVRERPSNRRRMESTSCQLSRLGYSDAYRWVDIYAEPDEGGDCDDEAVRDIYILNVLQWGLPFTDEERDFIAKRFVPEFLATFPTWSEASA